MEILKSTAIKFQGRLISNFSMYKLYIYARGLSFTIALLGFCSGCLSIIADNIGYALLANILPIACPVVLLVALRHIRWAPGIFRSYSIVYFVGLIILIIVNSFMISDRVQTYRYCFSDLTDYCEQSTEGDNSYDCRQEFDSTLEHKESLSTVNCMDEAMKAVFIAAIVFNLGVCILLVPYNMILERIRLNLYEFQLTGQEFPEDYEIRAHQVSVIIRVGTQLPLDSEFTCIGDPFEEKEMDDDN